MFKLVGLDLSLTHLSLAALLTRVIYMFLSVGVNVEVNVGRSQALAAMSSLGRGGISSIGMEPCRVDPLGVFGVEPSIMRWNSVFVFGLILSGFAWTVCYLFEWIHPNRVTRQKNRKRKRGRRNWRRRAKEFRRRRLHLNLVKRCRRRAGNMPTRGWMDPEFLERTARRRYHRENASEAKECWKFYGAPRRGPTHVDASVWEPLLNWFCFETYFTDDFPANGRMSTTLDAEERDRWKQYLDESVELENHVGDATALEGRAELARRSMDGNRGRANATRESFVGPRNTSRWSTVFGCWRRTSQHSVVGRLALANDSTHPGYFGERRSSDHFGGASAGLARTDSVSIGRDRFRTVLFDTGASQSTEQRLHRRKQLIYKSNDRRLQRKRIEVQAFQRETQTAVDQTPIDITPPPDLHALLDNDWSRW